MVTGLFDPDADGIMRCPESGFRYKEVEPGVVRCLDLDEESPLPTELSIGSKTYDEFKSQKLCRRLSDEGSIA